MTTDSSTAWTSQQLAENPHEAGDKPQRVRAMFANIARSYDLNNRLHSFWLDTLWRKAAVKAADVRPGDRVLDCACGTGDLTQEFARSAAESVIGSDFTPEMLDGARHKQTRLPRTIAGKISYEHGDATRLEHDDNSFDVLSIAFGIRNVNEPDRALAEFFRVLRPGGRLIILEFGTPKFAPIRWANNLYTQRIMPLTATLISGDRSGAYRYLPRSIETFLTPESLSEAVSKAGFESPSARPLTFGVCVCHRAVKPAGSV